MTVAEATTTYPVARDRAVTLTGRVEDELRSSADLLYRGSLDGAELHLARAQVLATLAVAEATIALADATARREAR